MKYKEWILEQNTTSNFSIKKSFLKVKNKN